MKAAVLRPLLAAGLKRWFLILLLVLFAALSIQYTQKALDPRGTRSAILRWREQFQAWDGGEDIFNRYPNPPIMALILKPLAGLPPLAGALTWFYLKAGMALVSLWCVFRMVEGPGEEDAETRRRGDAERGPLSASPRLRVSACFPGWAKALTVLLSIRPIMGDLSHGNVNLFILFLVALALFAFTRGRQVTAGVLVGLAVACKVTPALFLVYFLWKRAWRAAAGGVLGLVLFFLLVPAAFWGWQETGQSLGS